MSNELFKELSAQLIETSKWDGIEQGVVGSIEFMTSQKLEHLKGSMQRKELQKVLSEAKKSESFIIKYLKLDTIPKDKKIVEFSLPPLPITKKDMRAMKDLYENIFNLYLYRNPSEPTESITSLIDNNKELHVDFGVDTEKNKFFIRRIYIQDSIVPEKKESEKKGGKNGYFEPFA